MLTCSKDKATLKVREEQAAQAEQAANAEQNFGRHRWGWGGGWGGYPYYGGGGWGHRGWW